MLEAIARFKYNEYQQYSPGIQFIESLVKWLSQFEKMEERTIAYDFVKERLIFLSSDQISHLISIAFTEKINPLLINKTAAETQLNPFHIRRIINTQEYKNNLRKSLFIGMSDGSKIDLLRRTSNIDNEQVLTTYFISNTKQVELLKDLQEACPNSKFTSIFLVDDFTASGKSFFRKENGANKGKVFKFLSSLFFPGQAATNNNSTNQDLSELFDLANLEVNILFYAASTYAIQTINQAIQEWKAEKNLSFSHHIMAIQEFDDTIKQGVIDSTFYPLLELYFDKRIMDEHYERGQHDKPWLGFHECGLPLVLFHNTPNNSLPILWLPEDKDPKKFVGLFPRVTRHKE